MVMTGHSLGRNKLEQLVKQGRLTKNDINSTYKIMRRIEGEETGIDVAEMVVTSTKQEIEEQWGLYDGFDLMLERKLRVRKKRGVSCLGRHMPRMVVSQSIFTCKLNLGYLDNTFHGRNLDFLGPCMRACVLASVFAGMCVRCVSVLHAKIL